VCVPTVASQGHEGDDHLRPGQARGPVLARREALSLLLLGWWCVARGNYRHEPGRGKGGGSSSEGPVSESVGHVHPPVACRLPACPPSSFPGVNKTVGCHVARCFSRRPLT
jgi:hypothetical protein